MSQTTITGVHLVGSVPLTNGEEVFRTVSGALGRHLERVPDGETGERINWIAWQFGVLARTPGLEPVAVGDRGYLRRQLVRLGRGTRPGQLRFGPLGYADAALRSWGVFRRLKAEGVIPSKLRFQVSLPTPLAPMTVFVALEDRPVVEPAYEGQMLEELHRIVSGIPHEQLAIQWDVAVEMGHLEGFWPAHFANMEGGILSRLVELGRAVPRDVHLGYHLCYGDFGHKHFMQPTDAGRLVHLANGLLSRLERPAQWIHMPIPRRWTEPASFAPLANLLLPPQTSLYLGLVHLDDGILGGLQRIGRAMEFVSGFGIATECGWGRRPPETIPELMHIHAQLAERVLTREEKERRDAVIRNADRALAGEGETRERRQP